MYKYLVVSSILFLVTGIAGANDGQVVWCLGGGVPGPVNNWIATFDQSSNICFWDWGGVVESKNPIIDPKLRLNISDKYLIELTFDDYPYSACSSDIDNDGDEDIIAIYSFFATSFGSEELIWWENLDGTGSSWDKHVIDTGFPYGRSVVSADVDGNGTMDVAAAGNDDDACWWSNTDGTGTVWEEHQISDVANKLECADLDGDGDLDFALSSWWFATFSWCENVDGIGETWVEHGIAEEMIGAICGNPCDINSDGYLDYIALEFYNNKLYWWENEDGTGATWIEHVISSSFSRPKALHAGDIDGDGDIDVSAVSGESDDVVWFRNEDGFGGEWTEVFVTHQTIPYNRSLNAVHTADLDADGDLDICSSVSSSSGWVFWCENLDGIGESWEVHEFALHCNASQSLYASDINGDGKNDLLSSFSAGQEVAWYDLHEHGYCSSEGFLESSILDTDEDFTYYLSLSWQSEVPSGTELSVQIRASDDYSNMGDWSELLYSSPVNVDEVVGDGEKYFQYRVNMETSNPEFTPWLSYISLSWNGLGIGDSNLDSSGILSVSSNPFVSGFSSVIITCDNPMTMELSVFDLSGRMVLSVPEKEYEAGINTVSIQNIPSGIYMCLLNGEDFQESIRFVLTE